MVRERATSAAKEVLRTSETERGEEPRRARVNRRSFDSAPRSIVHRRGERRRRSAQDDNLVCYASDSASSRFQVRWLRRKDFFRSSRMRSKSAWVRRRFQAGLRLNQG